METEATVENLAVFIGNNWLVIMCHYAAFVTLIEKVQYRTYILFLSILFHFIF